MRRYFNSFKDDELIEYQVNKTLLNNLNQSKDIQSFNGGIVTFFIKKIDEILEIKIKGTIDLSLISSYSFKPFKTNIEIKDKLYFTDNENYESEEVFLINNMIDFDEILYSLVLVSIPINPYKEGEDTTSISGIKILQEEDVKSETFPLSEKLDKILKNVEE